jgi:glycosyltransferase involved in cell wall biosynthesis
MLGVMRIAIVTEDKRNAPCFRQEPEPLFGTAPTALLEGLAAVSQCEVHVLSCVQEPVRSPEKLADNIYYHSLLAPKWGWMRGAYAGCVLAVRKKARQLQPDLVHGQGTERYCALAAALSGFPSILTIHGNMRQLAKLSGALPFSFAWLAAQFERLALPRARGIVCNSRHTQNLVKELAATTWLVPNPVRSEFFSTPALRATSYPPVLLKIGLIGPNKSQNEILEIAERLHQRKVPFHLYFIGPILDQDRSYRNVFLERIKLAEKQGYARYLGEKWGRELIKLMDSASALVHIPREESFGLVAAEGLARNLKLFGSRVGGLLDIAEGTDGAELFEREKLIQLEEALFKWLTSGHLKPTLAAQQMRERYHPEKIARRHLEVYREVLKTRS